MTTTTVPPVRAASADLANLLVLEQLLKKDEEFDAREREERDRDIRWKLSASRSLQQGKRLLFWMQEVYASDAKVQEDAKRIREAVRNLDVVLLEVGLLFFGLFAGGTAASSAFFYDGTDPLNVSIVILVLVVPQIILLFLFAIAALFKDTPPVILTALVRLVAWLADFAFGKVLPETGRHKVREVLDNAQQREHHYSTVVKWLVFRWSQSMAIVFNVFALVTAFALMAFTDLAFVWGSTFTDSPTTAQRFAAGIATPWAWLLPCAVPDQELVEISHSFRLSMEYERIDPTTAERLGGWWPFILLTMLVYGLVPRLLTCIYAHMKFRSANPPCDAWSSTGPGMYSIASNARMSRRGVRRTTRESVPNRVRDVQTRFRRYTDRRRLGGHRPVRCPRPYQDTNRGRRAKSRASTGRDGRIRRCRETGRRHGHQCAEVSEGAESVSSSEKKVRREPLVQAAEGLTVDRANRGKKAAHRIAEMLEEILTLSKERELSPDGDAKIVLRDLEKCFKEELLRIENDCRENVEIVYSCNRLLRREDDDEILNADLFSKEHWVAVRTWQGQARATLSRPDASLWSDSQPEPGLRPDRTAPPSPHADSHDTRTLAETNSICTRNPIRKRTRLHRSPRRRRKS